MSVRPAGPYPIPGVGMETWLVRFDKNGVCTSPKTRAALLQNLAAKKDRPVLFFSHGWNNDFAGAVQLYKNFLSQLETVLKKNLIPHPSPIFVGITWPSMWLPSDAGPQMAATDASLDQSSAVEHVLNELLDVLPAGTNWARLYELMESDGLGDGEARELAAMLKPALKPSDDGPQEAVASEDKIIEALRAVQQAETPQSQSDDLDDIGTVAGAAAGPAPTAALGLGFLDPRWAVRLVSLYIMKDRAGLVGWNGIAPLLRDILQSSAAPVYAAGHSFGCKVMLSALAHPAPMKRKLDSLLLLQPAISHLSFAASVPGREGPGGYRLVLDRVAKPVFSTYSANDIPLHDIYHLALLRRGDLGELQIAAGATAAGNPPSAYAALGGYGPRNADECLIDPIPAPGEDFKCPAGKRLIGFDGSQFKRIDSHGGVANPYTAWVLRKQMVL